MVFVFSDILVWGGDYGLSCFRGVVGEIVDSSVLMGNGSDGIEGFWLDRGIFLSRKEERVIRNIVMKELFLKMERTCICLF